MTKKNVRNGFLHNPTLIIGMVLLLVLLTMAFFPQLFTSLDPNAYDAKSMLLEPCREHIFGTDNYGRDIFARVIYATSVDLQMGFLCMLVPFLFGTFLGLLSGYYGGKFDMLVMRIVDIFMAFPFMVLVIAIVAVIGVGVKGLYIAMWLVGWKEYTRLVRSEVLVVKKAEYVEAAKTTGFSDMRIIFRHIFPNVINSAIVYAASDVVMCMLAGASLSYLGLGVQAPTAEWGAIISGGKSFITTAWWISVFPGLFLAAAGFCVMLIGDGISDMLRVKQR